MFGLDYYSKIYPDLHSKSKRLFQVPEICCGTRCNDRYRVLSHTAHVRSPYIKIYITMKSGRHDLVSRNVKFSIPCLAPSLYCSVSELKCVAIHNYIPWIVTSSVKARYWYGDIILDINWAQNLIASGYHPFCLF